MVTITCTDTTRFRYLWLKNVKGFTSSTHCARCLKGAYVSEFGLEMPQNEAITYTANPGDLLYFCGVAKPYRWENNMHLAGEVKAGSVSEIRLHNGGTLKVDGLQQIEILQNAALERFPDLSEKFLTCRNFQFGAQLF